MIVHYNMPIDTSPDVVRCPDCDSRDVRPSKQRSLWDTLAKSARLNPFRCHRCRNRFYTKLRRTEDMRPELSGELQTEQSY